ncbi:MAG: spermidine synthase [Pseudomonadota bacterium]
MAASALVGAWELVVTRVASALYFYDVAFLVLSVCLFALGIGAMLAGRLQAGNPVYPLCGMLVLSPPVIYPLLNLSDLAWMTGLFALPFLLFGMLATLVWRGTPSIRGRRWLYTAELSGAILGLLLIGPVLLSLLPVSMLGDVGVSTHLKVTAAEQGVVDHFSETSTYARTDFLVTRQASVRYAFTDGMFVTRSVAWDGVSQTFSDPATEAMAAMKRLALRVGNTDRIVLLGAGAGFDIALALQEGAGRIDAVEVNPATIAFARRHDDWAGGILRNPRVHVHLAEARRFMASAAEASFDHIGLTLLQTSPAGLRGVHHVDARVLTVEAVQDYLLRLREGGIVAVIQNSVAFAANTEAVLRRAVHFDDSRLLCFRLARAPGDSGVEGDNPFTFLVLAGREPFSATRRHAAEAAAAELGAVLVSRFPGVPSPAPATDDRPFFFEPASRLLGQTLLIVAFVLLASGFLMFRRRSQQGSVALALSAMLIGFATMGVQVIALYWCQAAIGNPVQAMAVALAAVLGGSAAGALGFGQQQLRIARWVPGGIAAVVTALALGLGPLVTNLAQQHSHQVAVVGIGLFLFIWALPLGWPYLAAMELARENPQGEGTVIAFDGFGGVVGAVGVAAIAVALGFTMAGWAIVLAFVLLGLLVAHSS